MKDKKIMGSHHTKKALAAGAQLLNVRMYRADRRRSTLAISDHAATEIALVDVAEKRGDLTASEAATYRQGYRFLGERDAAGLPPVDLTF
jgi:hypothetical protein